MPKEKVEEKCKGHGHMGYGALVLGLLILANAYWTVVSWPYFIGIILVLAGIIKIIKKAM